MHPKCTVFLVKKVKNKEHPTEGAVDHRVTLKDKTPAPQKGHINFEKDLGKNKTKQEERIACIQGCMFELNVLGSGRLRNRGQRQQMYHCRIWVGFCEEQWKFDTLCDIFDSVAITQAVIFCILASY